MLISKPASLLVARGRDSKKLKVLASRVVPLGDHSQLEQVTVPWVRDKSKRTCSNNSHHQW
jgi:hypothetical protein